MAEHSAIEWTHHTFNPWRGCTKVSDGCKNCYAETLSARNPAALGQWGPQGARVIAAEAYWTLPAKWDRKAKQAGERRRVFCASLADVFEGPETMPAAARKPVAEARRRLFGTIQNTPNLDWLLLTKRPENVLPMLAAMPLATSNPGGPSLADGMPYPNVWFGTSVEDQPTADERIPHLMKVPAAVRFLSCEPLLGPIDLSPPHRRGTNVNQNDWLHDLDWIIAGGESGPGARPMHPAWARKLRDQCANRTDMGRAWPLPFLFKQWGQWIPEYNAGELAASTKTMASGGNRFARFEDGTPMMAIGKKAAGRLLDGVLHDAYPNHRPAK